MRGASEKPDWYGSAIKGGSGPAESVWGWGKLSQMTRSNQKFRDTFHQARYNIAVCRKEWAETYKVAEKKRQELELAKDDIRNTRDFESTLGGGVKARAGRVSSGSTSARHWAITDSRP